MPQYGELDFGFWIAVAARTVEIDNAAASGALTVHDTAAGTRFAVYAMFLEAEGATDIQVRSGATDISGTVAFAAGDEKLWSSGGDYPLFAGRAAADDFVLNIGSAVQVNGWAVLVEINTR